MVRLTDDKINYLAKAVSSGKVKSKDIARLYSVSQRRIQQLTKKYRDTGTVPKLNPNRRSKAELTVEEKEIINDTWNETKRSPRLLFLEIKEKGYKISKNRIYRYLKETGRIIPNKNKQKKRKRCRYERRYTGELIHTDWHRTSVNHPHVIAILDDASRKIIVANEYDQENSKNSIETLEQAVTYCRDYSLYIRELNCDHGSEFVNNNGNSKTNFIKKLEEHTIRLVTSRVNNPQTNGKLERFWYEYDKHRWRFKSVQEFIDWYNGLIHGEIMDRPNRAFIRKLPEESIVGMFGKLIKW